MLLKKIADISAGQSAPQGDENYCDYGTPFVKAGNLNDLINGVSIQEIQKVSDEVAKSHRLKLRSKGSILFAKSGMSCLKGYVYVLPCDAYVVSHLACITPYENISDYLKYYFTFNKPNTLIKDNSYPSISLTDIGNIDIKLKNTEEIKEIVHTLDTLQSIITHRRTQLEKLDLLVKARFVEMFGGIHNSELYPYITIEKITSVTSGGTPDRKNAEYWENGTINWVKTTELKNSIISNTDEKITEKGMRNSAAKIVPKNTVLVAMYGQGKTRGMTGYLEIESTTNQACACILPSKKINSVYLWKYMILSYDKLRNMAKGGNQPNLNTSIIKQFPVLMPPLDLQTQFADFVQQVDKSRVAVQKELDKAQMLFDSLMQEYFG